MVLAKLVPFVCRAEAVSCLQDWKQNLPSVCALEGANTFSFREVKSIFDRSSASVLHLWRKMHWLERGGRGNPSRKETAEIASV